MSDLSIDALRSLIELVDGRLVWRHTSGGSVKAGHEIGTFHEDGYRRAKIRGKSYLVHRLVFALCTGRWPTGDVDHVNGRKDDNRPENLREVTNRQNHQNRPSHRNGRLVGVTFCKRTKRWMAQVRHDGRRVFLGRHDTEAAAHTVYAQFLASHGLEPIIRT